MKKVCYIKAVILLTSLILLPVLYNCDNDDLGIYDYVELDVEPKPISIPAPEYPALARLLGLEGRVIVRILVDIDGTVAHALVEISSGYLLLDNAALDAARKALFEPAMNDGEPVKCWIAIPFNFQLE